MEKENAVISKKKAGIDKNPTKDMGEFTIRDGSVISVYRLQDAEEKDGVIYGEIVAKLDGDVVGKCVYSFPGTENARLLGIVVDEYERGKGIGSTLLNSFIIDALVTQRRSNIVATSSYNFLTSKFMEKNYFKVMPNSHQKEVNYSIYEKDRERMALVLEQSKNPARIDEEELYY